MKSPRSLLRTLTRPTVIPDFLTQPIFYQVRNYHQIQYWNRWKRRLWIAFGGDYELVTKERIVEVPFSLQAMDLPVPSRILEFGCYGSTLAMELASLGHQVTGVDLRHYPLEHPNFRFLRGDFMTADLAPDSFDGAIAISAVEHAGLGAYEEKQFERGDRRILERIRRILKPGGRLALTVPYGKPGETSTYRVYDEAALRQLLTGYDIHTESFFKAGPGRSHWLPATKAELATVDSTDDGWIKGLACVIALNTDQGQP